MSAFYEIAASQTDSELKGSGEGGKGDIIKKIIFSVDTAGAGSAASIKDGTNAIPVIPASSPVGVHVVDFSSSNGDGLISQNGSWKITTGANVTAIVIGDFK